MPVQTKTEGQGKNEEGKNEGTNLWPGGGGDQSPLPGSRVALNNSGVPECLIFKFHGAITLWCFLFIQIARRQWWVAITPPALRAASSAAAPPAPRTARRRRR